LAGEPIPARTSFKKWQHYLFQEHIRLEKEAQDQAAIGGEGLVAIALRAPNSTPTKLKRLLDKRKA